MRLPAASHETRPRGCQTANDYFWRKATEYTQRAAEETTDEELRTFFSCLRDAWIAAANRAEMIAGLDVHVPMGASPENPRIGTRH